MSEARLDREPALRPAQLDRDERQPEGLGEGLRNRLQHPLWVRTGIDPAQPSQHLEGIIPLAVD